MVAENAADHPFRGTRPYCGSTFALPNRVELPNMPRSTKFVEKSRSGAAARDVIVANSMIRVRNPPKR